VPAAAVAHCQHLQEPSPLLALMANRSHTAATPGLQTPTHAILFVFEAF
jgi:hypothetical protein